MGKSEHNTLASNQLASNTLNDQQPRSYRQMDDFYKKECARSIGLQQPMAPNNLNVSKPNMLQIPTSNVGPPAPSVLTNQNQNPMMNLNGNYQISMTHQNNNNNNNNFLQQPVIANSSQMEPSSNISFVSVNSESNNNNVVNNNGVNNQFYNHQNQQANNHNNLQNHPDSNKLALSSTINSNLNNNNNNNQITNDTNSKQAFQISNHSFLNLQNSHQNNNFIAHQIEQQQQQQIQAQAQALAQAQANQPNQLVNQQQTN